MAHITGGGFYENIPRMFFDQYEVSYKAVIREGSWTIPPIFARIACACYQEDGGKVAANGKNAEALGAELMKNDPDMKKQMFNTFNMGIGFVLALAPGDVRQAVEHLDGMGFPAWEIGRVEKAAGTGEGALRFVQD